MSWRPRSNCLATDIGQHERNETVCPRSARCEIDRTQSSGRQASRSPRQRCQTTVRSRGWASSLGELVPCLPVGGESGIGLACDCRLVEGPFFIPPCHEQRAVSPSFKPATGAAAIAIVQQTLASIPLNVFAYSHRKWARSQCGARCRRRHMVACYRCSRALANIATVDVTCGAAGVARRHCAPRFQEQRGGRWAGRVDTKAHERSL